MLGTRRSSPYFPHPSHDSQLISRLATTITMLVMSKAKQENSRRSLTRTRILAHPLCLPLCSVHVDTPRHCPSFVISRACFPTASLALSLGCIAARNGNECPRGSIATGRSDQVVRPCPEWSRSGPWLRWTRFQSHNRSMPALAVCAASLVALRVTWVGAHIRALVREGALNRDQCHAIDRVE